MKLHHWPLIWFMVAALWAGTTGYCFGSEMPELAGVTLASTIFGIFQMRNVLVDLERLGCL